MLHLYECNDVVNRYRKGYFCKKNDTNYLHKKKTGTQRDLSKGRL